TGSLASAVTVNTGATLAGTGSVGPVTVNSGGTLSPGLSPGIITIAGNYAENGTLAIEILNHTGGPGVGYDQVAITGGHAILGATSVLTLTYTGAPGAFTPAPLQMFTIIDNDGTADLNTGQFGSVTGFPGTPADG